MKLLYISENKIYFCDNGKVKELKSERVEKYTDAVKEINRNKEWKSSGTGAAFLGNINYSSENENVPTSIKGVASFGDELIYALYLGGMGGIYRKSIENPEASEEHILTQMNTKIDEISYKNDKLAVVMNGHIAVVDMKGNYNEITDGDTDEANPFWSETDERIFCSTAGYARAENGIVAAVSPRSIMAIDMKNNTMDELYSDEKTDYLKPSNDKDGNFYYITQPYKVVKENEPLWKDILLFPVRLIKAIGGFLNAFSVIFGGESLRGNKQKGDVKMKQKSEKELYFEGRLIEAEKNERENAAKGEKNAGILPFNRVLVSVDSSGNEKILKRGVLDYVVLDDGSFICSNGRYILHIKDGEESVIAKAKLAHSLCVLK